MNQPEQVKDNNNAMMSEVLEQGDIYFFYRPKKDAEKVKGFEDIRHFFMVTVPEGRRQVYAEENESQIYRLFVLGGKSLPEIRKKSEGTASERYWARVVNIFTDRNELTKELFSDKLRKGDTARPVGEGKYAIVKHQNHAELAYILEMPKEPGEAQKELGVEKEASYIISVINPKKPAAASAVAVGGGYPTPKELPMYPEEVLNEFKDSEIFVSLSKDTRLIDYQNAQIILIGAREGRDVIRKEIGVEISDEDETQQSADIFTKLKIQRYQVPIKPLIEGKLE